MLINILIVLVVADICISIYSRRLSNQMMYKMSAWIGTNAGDILTLKKTINDQQVQIGMLKSQLAKCQNKK